ncbi:MAG: hypothetical protein GYB68_17740 [Chloroflexi bacterium]|nr:hypothetical protein [Chloroflexota bacterium]
MAEYDELASVYGMMLEIAPEDANLWVARAIVVARLGDSESAIDDLMQMEQIDPARGAAWVNVAGAASGQRHYHAAIEISTAGLDIHQELVSLWMTRGLALLSLDEEEEALADFEQAAALDTTSVQAHLWRGRALRALDQIEESIEASQLAAELGAEGGVAGANSGFEAMADAADAIALSNPSDAFEYLANQVFIYGSREAILLGYARVDYRRGSVDLAVGRLNRLVFDGYLTALLWRGIILADEGDDEEAIADLEAFLEIRASGPEAEQARALLERLEAGE